jgi:hypothetical protein
MQQKRYSTPSPTRGGARAGAGRPKGSTNKITMEGLLTSLDARLGVSYADQIADNYVQAIQREDWSGVRDYDRVLLGKIVADRQAIEVTDSEDAVEARRAAFADALTALTQVGVK